MAQILHQFITILFVFCLSTLFYSCKNSTKAQTEIVEETTTETKTTEIKYSLAQWSYNRDLFAGDMNTFDFIKKAKEHGFHGVEYVNQFFKDKAENNSYLDSLKQISLENQIQNVMIMIDREGDLGDPDEEKRKEAVANHKKWIDAAAHIDCISIRVNAHGTGTEKEVLQSCTKSIKELADYGQTKKIQILIENHGGYSSDAAWLLSLYNNIKHSNVSLLADFDNWCIEREDGKLWGSKCIKEYDRQKGMKELLPHSKGISIKSFEFDENGNETKMDYPALFKIMKESNYNSFYAIEYEGHTMDSDEGIKKTKSLAEKMIKEIY